MAEHKIDGNVDAGNVDLIEKSTKRQHFTDVRHVTVRWEPYKPDGARQMKAKGRWQEQVGTGDYFRWQNCNRPAFAHDPETIEDLTAQLAAAKARAEGARDAALVEAADIILADNYDDPDSAADAILALRDKPAPGVTVQEAARVLLGVFEDPDANAPHGFDWQSMYDEMTADHKESLDICGTHDWPSTLIVALRAIAASEA